jgi:5-methyltetrahydrofolate--homocysteine methyltransferase
MEHLKELVKDGDDKGAASRVQLLLDEGKAPEQIMNQALIPAMDVVGDLFQQGEYYLPEMLIAARAMRSGMAVLKPLLVDSGVENVGKLLIGTVKGDMHDIGKNLVAMSLEGAGFEVVDLGVDVSPGRFIESIREHKPLAIGLSALLTSTMVLMRETVDALREAGLRDQVKIMIGGAPVTQEFCDEIGADFFGADSTAGRNYARSLVT